MNINKTHYFNAPINKDDFKNLDNMEIISIFNNIKLFFDNVNSNNQYHDLYDFNINDVNDTNISLEKESVSIIDEYFYILKNSKINERFDINNDIDIFKFIGLKQMINFIMLVNENKSPIKYIDIIKKFEENDFNIKEINRNIESHKERYAFTNAIVYSKNDVYDIFNNLIETQYQFNEFLNHYIYKKHGVIFLENLFKHVLDQEMLKSFYKELFLNKNKDYSKSLRRNIENISSLYSNENFDFIFKNIIGNNKNLINFLDIYLFKFEDNNYKPDFFLNILKKLGTKLDLSKEKEFYDANYHNNLYYQSYLGFIYEDNYEFINNLEMFDYLIFEYYKKGGMINNSEEFFDNFLYLNVDYFSKNNNGFHIVYDNVFSNINKNSSSYDRFDNFNNFLNLIENILPKFTHEELCNLLSNNFLSKDNKNVETDVIINLVDELNGLISQILLNHPEKNEYIDRIKESISKYEEYVYKKNNNKSKKIKL